MVKNIKKPIINQMIDSSSEQKKIPKRQTIAIEAYLFYSHTHHNTKQLLTPPLR